MLRSRVAPLCAAFLFVCACNVSDASFADAGSAVAPTSGLILGSDEPPDVPPDASVDARINCMLAPVVDFSGYEPFVGFWYSEDGRVVVTAELRRGPFGLPVYAVTASEPQHALTSTGEAAVAQKLDVHTYAGELYRDPGSVRRFGGIAGAVSPGCGAFDGMPDYTFVDQWSIRERAYGVRLSNDAMVTLYYEISPTGARLQPRLRYSRADTNVTRRQDHLLRFWSPTLEW